MKKKYRGFKITYINIDVFNFVFLNKYLNFTIYKMNQSEKYRILVDENEEYTNKIIFK